MTMISGPRGPHHPCSSLLDRDNLLSGEVHFIIYHVSFLLFYFHVHFRSSRNPKLMSGTMWNSSHLCSQEGASLWTLPLTGNNFRELVCLSVRFIGWYLEGTNNRWALSIIDLSVCLLVGQQKRTGYDTFKWAQQGKHKALLFHHHLHQHDPLLVEWTYFSVEISVEVLGHIR